MCEIESCPSSILSVIPCCEVCEGFPSETCRVEATGRDVSYHLRPMLSCVRSNLARPPILSVVACSEVCEGTPVRFVMSRRRNVMCCFISLQHVHVRHRGMSVLQSCQ